MYKIKQLNKIAAIGLLELPTDNFLQDNNDTAPDGLLVRSASMHEMELPDSLLCVARAGAGVNNIPLDACSEKAIVVFNTPGANANAVRELVLCSLFLSARDIVGGIEWAKKLTGDDIPAQVEKGKSQFVGPELAGKTLGIVGLGAIGVGVANAAHHFGMDVLGFDPYISVDSAWGLSRNIRRARDVKQVFAESDYLTLHVPLNKETKQDMMQLFAFVKPGVRLLNFSRGELLPEAELLDALERGIIARYVTDFPTGGLINHPKVVPIPHLGASTPESEDNCAVMACVQMREYLQYGNTKNSVNMPDVELPYLKGSRLCVIHRNIPHMLSQISSTFADASVNIENMVSKSKKDYAYTMLDVGELPDNSIIDKLRDYPGILKVRLLNI